MSRKKVSDCEVQLEDGKVTFYCKYELFMPDPTPSGNCAFSKLRADCGDACGHARHSLCTSREAKKLALDKFSRKMEALLRSAKRKLERK